MIKANAKYTAKELVDAAGLDTGVFGEVGIEIGGIKGIVKPDHIIRVTAGTTSLDVRVGDKTVPVEVSGDNEETEISEGARAALDAKGK
jgi:hypothetical protein